MGTNSMLRRILSGFMAGALLVVLIACTAAAQTPGVSEAANEALKALKTKDMKKLAAMAHPQKGVRFTPYAYVDDKRDLVFKPDQLEKLLSDGTIYEWGTYDGSGEPIRLKFTEYYGKFVFDKDFTTAKKTAVDRPIGKSTTKNNLAEVYPPDRHTFVEYHIEGTDPKLQGMDWKSLRLVFEREGDKLYLVGVVHDQWTT